MPPQLIQALLAASLISPEVAEELGHLGDLDPERIEQIAADLTAHVATMLGDDEDPDPEPVSDDTLTVAASAADAIEALRGETDRRRQARSAVLSRLRPTDRTGSSEGTPSPPAPGEFAGRPTARTGRVGARGGQARQRGGQHLAHTLTAGGRPVPDRASVVAEMTQALNSLASPTGAPAAGQRRVVASSRTTYPEALQLGQDADVNRSRLDAVVGHDALVAAGGYCAPAESLYAFDVGADNARPVASSMPRFGATRGAVQYFPAMAIDDFDEGVGIWTNAMDIDAADGTPTKNITTLDCPTPVTVELYAVTRQLRFGNFRARFFPEQVEGALQTMAAAWARQAEGQLLTTMTAGSVAVTTPTVLSATRDVLDALDRAFAAMRARQRLGESQFLRLIAPSWLRNMIRTDLAREIPGAPADRLATSALDLDSFFGERSVMVTWTPDLDIAWAATQAAGPLLAWPTTAQALLFVEGAWAWLDGGTLDLGVVRDSTLMATNEAISFMEGFEAVAHTGGESLALTMTLAPTGSTSGTTDLVAP